MLAAAYLSFDAKEVSWREDHGRIINSEHIHMIPTIKITYQCFSDTLTVIAALVFQGAKYEAND
jgi:hypothetical protein